MLDLRAIYLLKPYRDLAPVVFTCLLRPVVVVVFALSVLDPCPNKPEI